MQDCHNKINKAWTNLFIRRKNIFALKMKHWSIYIIFATFPFILIALLLLEPTSDDWSYLTNPYFGDPFLSERIFPDGNHWRPFDALYGSFISHFTWLYPSLNHIIILSAHYINACLVYTLSRKLFSNDLASNISTLFFFISPAMAGTVFGIDSINQAMSHLFGLSALYIFLQYDKRYISLWILLIFISMLSKENGVSWAIISPLIAFGVNKINKNDFIRYIILSLLVIGIYIILRFSLSDNAVNGDSVYFDFSVSKKIKDLGVFITMTWMSIDFVSLAHAPSINYIILLLSIILSIPIFIYVIRGSIKNINDKLFITLSLSVLIAAAPHLLTLFGAMHAYSSLGLSALLLSYIINRYDSRKFLIASFMAYSLSAIAVDYRHYIKSYESGMTGYNMAKNIVEKCNKQYEKVFLINIDDNYPSYSSFCVSPFNAFGWGNAAIKYNEYKWPKEVCDTVIEKNNARIIENIATKAIKKGYDCVWLCNGQNIDIIKEK